MKIKLSKEEWLLLVIAEAGKTGLTPVKLQKSLFLLNENFHSQISDFYKFIPYNYGPFDIAIYKDTEDLFTKGYVEKGTVNQSWDKYFISSLGKKKAKELSFLLPQKISSYLQNLIRWILTLSFQELVSSIYKAYPRYKINSVFRE